MSSQTHVDILITATTFVSEYDDQLFQQVPTLGYLCNIPLGFQTSAFMSLVVDMITIFCSMQPMLQEHDATRNHK